MKNDRALTAQLAIESELMPVIKQFAEHFGNNGKLPSVAVITKNGSAYYGSRPIKADKITPSTGW